MCGSLKQSHFVWLPVEIPLYLLMQMARTSFIQIMCVGDRIRLHLTLYYRVIAIYHPYAVHCIRHVWRGKHVYSRKRLLYHQEQFCTCQH